jgi:hypothetical protein
MESNFDVNISVLPVIKSIWAERQKRSMLRERAIAGEAKE